MKETNKPKGKEEYVMSDFERCMEYCEEEFLGTTINEEKTVVCAYVMTVPVLEWHFSKDGKLLETINYK